MRAGVPSSTKAPFFMTSISSAMHSTSDTMCVERMTILSCEKLEIRLRKRTRSFGSSPAVGSSSTSTAGSLTAACAMPRRCFMPPENVLIFDFATSCNPTSSSSSHVRRCASGRLRPLSAARYSMKSSAVKSG